MAACERDPNEAPPPALMQAPFEVTSTTAAALTTSGVFEPQAPRRGYGQVDMKLGPCMSIADKRTIEGKGCPSAIVVFGPYVSAPADSDVDISFEVEAKNRIALVSDVVSSSARQFHGALLEQWVEPGARRWFGYRVHLFNSVTSLESRIFVRADGSGDFAIRDFLINVR